jgi:hypothetical protein
MTSKTPLSGTRPIAMVMELNPLASNKTPQGHQLILIPLGIYQK